MGERRITDPEKLVTRLDEESYCDGLTLAEYHDHLRLLAAAISARADVIDDEVSNG